MMGIGHNSQGFPHQMIAQPLSMNSMDPYNTQIRLANLDNTRFEENASSATTQRNFNQKTMYNNKTKLLKGTGNEESKEEQISGGTHIRSLLRLKLGHLEKVPDSPEQLRELYWRPLANYVTRDNKL